MTFPYIANTEDDRRAMLQAIGVSSSQDLFRDIPEQRRNPPLRLPPPLSEAELKRELVTLAARNANAESYACFLGAGAYRHFIPSVVQHILNRSEFATAYTPYQPEVSQGVLQALYEFQSYVCEITGMEVANAGMYDGSTAMAEAALLACRVTGRHRVSVADSVNPTFVEVLRTYLTPQDIGLEQVSLLNSTLSPDTACLIVQQPGFLGPLEDLQMASTQVHQVGGLLAVHTNPIFLGLFAPPGQAGADVVTAEGQATGAPMSFGGPYVGLFACKQQHVRQMPSHIVGRTVDGQGRTGYVLTLQTREQHIRREKATSNICTTESLIALATAVYLAALGKQGLRQVAELCYHKAHYAARRIASLQSYTVPYLDRPFFHEFLTLCPRPVQQVNRHLLRRKIIGGLDVSRQHPNGMLLCVTEMNTRDDIDRLVAALEEAGRQAP